jgi:hypothetical protein
MKLIFPVAGSILSAAVIVTASSAKEPLPAPVTAHHNTAGDVFDKNKVIMLQDDFSSADPLKRWDLSEDARYELASADADRLSVVDAPGLPGAKAVRFFVNRAPNSFRSEISLPSEKGWNERWYAERILLPDDWVVDPEKGRTLVMQWHGIPGNFRATYPNLDIAVQRDKWIITRSFGDPKTQPTRDHATIDGSIEPGKWVSWVVHAKWSPDENGLLQIWKDGKLVFERKGPNVYGTIGVEYTPYLKTGIYHPFWHVTGDASRKDDASRAAYDAETASNTPVKNKTVYVADFKMGNEHATYDDVAPRKEVAAQ